jgi:glyoxylate/hydroxypyruvate reductase
MWLDAFRVSMPEVRVQLLGEIDDPSAVKVAIVRGVDPGELHRFPNLKFIQCMWAGVDKLLADPTFPRSIPLARTVDPAMADAMAATALAHVLDIALHHHTYRETQSRSAWAPLHAKPMAAYTVAILGLGSLGRRCAEYICFTGARVIGVRRGRSVVNDADASSPISITTDIRFAVSRANIVLNLLPLTSDTHGILDASLFAGCKPGAALINLGRGQHVVDSDLLDALDSGQLRRAVLDVFANEPLPAEDPLWAHPLVTITPHVAAETDPTTAAPVIAANIRAALEGRWDLVTGSVDQSKGY